MYEGTEATIWLSSGEVQQAPAIWLYRDGEKPIRFIKEKIGTRPCGWDVSGLKIPSRGQTLANSVNAMVSAVGKRLSSQK